MSGKNTSTALMVAIGVGQPIAMNSSGGAAEWIMLLPAGAGGVIATVDNRGPYRVGDPAKLATASLHAAQGRLPIDENHATDLAAPNGGPSPARGWATELQARDDGIYGRVQWSAPGAALMSERAYRFISPVFTHDKAGNITSLLRASLTNTPNLLGMAALHSTTENNMDLLAQLRKLLGLADDADEAAVIAKIKGWTNDSTATAAALAPIAQAAGLAAGTDAKAIATAVTALKSGTALASIAKAAGLKDDADAVSIAAAVSTLSATAAVNAPDQVKALQSELATVTTRLNDSLASTAKDKATAYIDGEIKRGRVGLKPMRDHYIARHSASAAGAAEVQKEIAALPVLTGGSTLTMTPPADSAASETEIDPVALASAATAYQTKLAGQGQTIDFATAVRAVASNPK